LLKDLLKNRQSDLETQRQTLVAQRDSYRLEIDDLDKENRNLREKIEQMTRDNLSSIEAFKVKIATLHQADITGLANLHEARITSLSEELAEKNRQLEEMKKRLHQEMQGKLHLRKEYEIEVAKLKNKIMDLRIQMNAVQIEMKDNITSMRSQLDVTSQGLIKDRETKARTIKSYED
jgi:chromosome segregation ATPase